MSKGMYIKEIIKLLQKCNKESVYRFILLFLQKREAAGEL